MLVGNQFKRVVRNEVRERLDAMEERERTVADNRICGAIRSLEVYEEAEQLIGYQALDDEVDLFRLVTDAVAAGKRVYLPVIGDGGGLVFTRWSPGDTLQTSALGVEEPTSSERPLAAATISLIPGRAFDAVGNRLGRGGGYYDRAMIDLKRFGVTIGIGYCCQFVDAVPVTPDDRRVEMLVNEAGVLRAVDDEGTD